MSARQRRWPAAAAAAAAAASRAVARKNITVCSAGKADGGVRELLDSKGQQPEQGGVAHRRRF